MKQLFVRIAVILAALILCIGCQDSDIEDTPVTFTSLTANGSTEETTTKLTLTFNRDIAGLTEGDITLSGSTGAVKDALTRTVDGVYELAVSEISVGGQVTVMVSKRGYIISPASKTVDVVFINQAVFTELTANGSVTESTSKLTLTFNNDIAGLNAADITLEPGDTGALKGELTSNGSGVYELAISNVSASGDITIAINKSGYNISPSSRNVTVTFSPTASTVTLTPDSVTINDTTLTATASVDGTATGTVTLTTTALPTGVTVAVEGTTITVTGVRPTKKDGSIDGSYTVGVTREGVTQNLTVVVNLTTTFNPDAPTVTLTPDSVTINDTTLTATASVSGTATGAVTLNTSALPAGVTATVSGTTITVTGVRPTAEGASVSGSYTVGVTREGVTQNLTVTVNLTTTWVAPTVTLTPDSVTVNGGNLTATVTVGGTATGAVTLNTEALPPEVTATVYGTAITVTGVRPTAEGASVSGSFTVGVTRQGVMQNLTVEVNLTTTWTPGGDLPTTAGLYLGEPETLTSSSTPIAEVAANNVIAAVTYVTTAANPDGAYTLLLDAADIMVTAEQVLSRANRQLTIIGIGAGETVISRTNNGRTFTVGAGSGTVSTISLTIGNNITLQGRTTNNNNVVNVRTGAAFTMLGGSLITGNSTTSSSYAAALNVSGANTVFTMKAGAGITGNTHTATSAVANNSAVAISSNARVVMEGGSISGNTALCGDLGFITSVTTSPLTMSGEAVIGVLTLNYTMDMRPPLTVASGWAGEVGALNLMGGNASLDTVIGYWYNASSPRFVMQAAAGHTLTAADVAKVTTGNFINNDGSETRPISPSDQEHTDNAGWTRYIIADIGANIGRLVTVPPVPGTISITPDAGVTIGDTLTVNYTGSAAISGYQWNKGGTAIPGETGTTYTPAQTGRYTVTASAAGYNSITSEPVTVTDANDPWAGFTAGLYLGAPETLTPSSTRIAGIAANNVTAAFNHLSNPGPAYEGAYTLLLDADDITVYSVQALHRERRQLTIIGIGAERTVIRSITNGSTFQVSSFSTTSLTIGNNITLQGRTNNTGPVVLVSSGDFTMLDGSLITGNTLSTSVANSNVAAALSVSGVFTMKAGASITGNTHSATTANYYTAAVVIGQNARVIMEGGSISGNTAICGDLTIDPDALLPLTMSGDAVIGVLTLQSLQSARTPLTIGSGWAGEVGALNLMGTSKSLATISLGTAIGYWYDASSPRVVMQAAAGHTLTAADVAKVTTANFINSTGSETRPINPGDQELTDNLGWARYVIADTGANIGRLVMAPPVPGTVNITPTAGVTSGTPLTAVYVGSAAISGYQWYRNGRAIPGATGSTYTLAVSGSYTVTASAAGYTRITSEPVTVTFGGTLPATVGLYHETSDGLVDTGVAANNVAAAVTRVNQAGAANDGAYFLLVDAANITVAAEQNLNIANRQLTIIGIGAEKTVISRTANGSTFTVGASGQTDISLTIGNNITLQGRIANNNTVVSVWGGAAFTMLDGSELSGNRSSASSDSAGQGAAVSIFSGSTFTMKGGTITNNIATGGSSYAVKPGGLYAQLTSTVVLEGGSITGNTGVTAGDAYFLHTANVTLSGTASVGTLTLNASDTIRSTLTIAPGWTGTVAALNLRGANTAMTTAISYWANTNPMLLGAGVNATTVGQITLGNFVSAAAALSFTQAISPTHQINASGVLEAKE